MLMNTELIKSSVVQFVSYDGKYPNLCRGILTLCIEGEEVEFGHSSWNWEENRPNDDNYDSFWSSGGGITRDYSTHHGEWEINVNSIPEKFRKYAREIDEVFNGNVSHGCCGGCI